MGGGSSKQKNPPVKETAAKPTGDADYLTFQQLLNHSDINELYETGNELGSGNMATVYKYTRKSTGKEYAAKVVLKNSLDKLTDFTNELEILAHLKGHPNILELEVRLYYCYYYLIVYHYLIAAFSKYMYLLELTHKMGFVVDTYSVLDLQDVFEDKASYYLITDLVSVNECI